MDQVVKRRPGSLCAAVFAGGREAGMTNQLRGGGLYLKSLFTGGWYSRQMMAFNSFYAMSVMLVSAVLRERMQAAAAGVIDFATATALVLIVAFRR